MLINVLIRSIFRH